MWVDRLDSRSRDTKPGRLKDHPKILPLSHEGSSASVGNLNAYVSHLFTYIRLTATESSIEEPCFTLVATIIDIIDW